MKLLLDTHVVIWWLEDNPRLGPKSRHLLADSQNLVLASIVSLWEITVKWRVGKLPLPGSAFATLLSEQGIDVLSVVPDHIRALETLALHHGDPFDHLILAQARVENATVMTADRAMTAYGVPCIGIG